MRRVKDFLKQNLPAMVDYILIVSTPVPDPFSPHSGHSAHSLQRHKDIVSSLHERGTTMPVLERESIPLLPHMLDIPRHLACITSSVIRSARSADSKAKSSQGDNQHLSDLCAQCFALEEQSLARVSQLAGVESPHTVLKWEVPRMPSIISSVSPVPPSPVSPSKSVEPRKVPRPYTAPSLSDLSETARRKAPSENSLPSSSVPCDLSSLRRGSVPDISPSPKVPPSSEDRTQHPRSLRPKSISTDSISTLVSRAGAEVSRTLRSPPDFQDEAGRKRKNVLQGILTKR
jgi:lambda repressor-like predicted transcriptional regulator